MKFGIAIVALFAATTQAVMLDREVYMRSLDEPSQYYSSLEQMDHEQEVIEASKQAEFNQYKKIEDAKKRLVELENK